jgi:molecular chaperone HscA
MALLQIAEPGLAAAPTSTAWPSASTSAPPTPSSPAGMAKALADESGHILLPSVVHYGETEMVVGREARAGQADDPSIPLPRSSA